MGKKDVYESDYLENAEIFADLVNGVLYHGRQVVKPQDLREQDGELSMCKAFIDAMKRGRAEEIIDSGREFNFSEEKILERLQKKLDISIEKAKEYMVWFEEQRI